jgi:RNA polymerase sigma factor (sigma-70 family)
VNKLRDIDSIAGLESRGFAALTMGMNHPGSQFAVVERREVQAMWKSLLPYATSYDEFINPDEDTRLEALISDPESLKHEQSVIRKETLEVLKGALRGLPSRERYILERRFGIVDDVEMTLGSIAHILKLSKERVRQLERDALGKLRLTLAQRRQDLLIS